MLLENVRFYKEEESGDNEWFSKKLASYGDVYVNETFACSHRNDASMTGIPKYIPGFVGLQVEKELHFLKLENPRSPVVAILGGSKLETKIPVIKNLLEKADNILIGGAMIFTFYKAKGLEIGKSFLNDEYLEEAKRYLKNPKIVLPKDVVVADSTDSTESNVVNADKISSNKVGLDLGPETMEEFKTILRKAKTIIWNGPLGYYESDIFAKATNEMANFLSQMSGPTTIVGGGDTAAVVNTLKLADKFTHVSTGGGASLAVLAGKKLVALEALN